MVGKDARLDEPWPHDATAFWTLTLFASGIAEQFPQHHECCQTKSPYVPVAAHQPQLDNSPYASASSRSMVGKPALTMEQSPKIPRGFFGKFSNPTSVPQTNAELTADETCAWEASSNAPSRANTETSWSTCDSSHPRDARSNRAKVDADSTSMAACAAPASPLLRGSERAASDLGRVICGGRRGRADRTPSATTSHRAAGSVHAGPLGLDSQWSSSGSSAAGAGFSGCTTSVC